MEKDFSALNKEFQKFRGGSDEKPRRPVSRLAFRRESSLARDLYANIPTSLFVPAARSFYSTISEELFTFLASEERIDPLISQFGSFYEFAKRRITGDWYSADLSAAEKEGLKDVIMPVIGGEYVREKSKDYIKTNWGRVPLRVSSSGQQEALPLLVALSQYPAALFGNKEQPRMLIVEEPEAHLFPTAQKYILDFMVSIASEKDCDILFTSHSPYILACLNNHIVQKAARSGELIEFSAYFCSDGNSKSIKDDDGIIDTQDLDEISTVIANEFYAAIE